MKYTHDCPDSCTLWDAYGDCWGSEETCPLLIAERRKQAAAESVCCGECTDDECAESRVEGEAS